MKVVTVVISEDGESSIDLAGFHGQGCAKVLRDFTDGQRVTVTREKPEFRETVKEKEVQRG